MDAQRRERGGIGVTQRGDRYEATYNVPKAEPPEGSKRVRITAHGFSAPEAQRKLLAKLNEHQARMTGANVTITPGRLIR